MRVSVVGLGKLGSPLAAVLASKGHHVIGVDLNAEFVRLLASRKAPVLEPRLQELIDLSRERLTATTDFEAATLGSDISFVIVPTPTDSKGLFTNKHVVAAVREIGKALRKKAGYHVVNITSTVMPGSTDGEIRDALETSSGRTVGHDVGLCYNPEFVALGSVVRDMLFPDVILIGESDPRAGDIVENLYATSCDNTPPVQRMNLINAELTKISINTFVTTKISYANMLADICDRLPGADVNVVTNAVGLDSRIGRKYLKGALGYGGPCFPRDNVAFGHLARALGAKADLAEATDRINRYQVERLVSLVTRRLSPGRKVGILGLSYKPDTGVIEDSQGVALAVRLADHGYEVAIYDPQALAAATAVLGAKAIASDSAESCVRAVDLLLITTAWPEFRDLPISAFVREGERMVVIDCWRMLPQAELSRVVDIVYIGHGGTIQTSTKIAPTGQVQSM
jgi:UDPglucose 6-dehydrogenase